jgi:cytochrome c oxidase subunit 3
LAYGMLLFIVSEIMFFFSFFWAFFYSSISPAIQIGSTWPPVGLEIITSGDLPLLNTFLLLTSGLTVT